ncbi:endonuclease domain-containing protein [Candidatus Uhrbacteria bacterium]|nr:endonuclease domain-containing protein [Candidatus Uhrbacteria bacterium]
MSNVKLARTLRHRQTDGERKLWSFLRDRRLGGYKFPRQHPVGQYIADFCCEEKFLIIEIDGSQHGTQIEKDAACTRYLEGQGYRVIRFGADAAVRETKAVIETILSMLQKPSPGLQPPSPRGRGELNKVSISITSPRACPPLEGERSR